MAGPVGLATFPLDDSWIHLQFARNLAEGRGFAYNPGVPVSGSTAPLSTVPPPAPPPPLRPRPWSAPGGLGGPALAARRRRDLAAFRQPSGAGQGARRRRRPRRRVAG